MQQQLVLIKITQKATDYKDVTTNKHISSRRTKSKPAKLTFNKK